MSCHTLVWTAKNNDVIGCHKQRVRRKYYTDTLYPSFNHPFKSRGKNDKKNEEDVGAVDGNGDDDVDVVDVDDNGDDDVMLLMLMTIVMMLMLMSGSSAKKCNQFVSSWMRDRFHS